MRALISRAAGPPETLEVADIAMPECGPGKLRVKIAAAAFNYPDGLMIEDKYQVVQPRPYIPGSEFSGTVAAIGDGVEGFAPGDRVVVQASSGGFGEYAIADAARTFLVPESVALDTAAALLVTYGTSHHALRDHASIRPGETLLVLGASGGVGLAAVELGKTMGARVVAGVSSLQKAQIARVAGADETFVYPRGPFDDAGRRELGKLFKQAVGPKGADVIYDPLGGDYADAAIRALAWEGRYLVIGFVAGIPALRANLLLLKAASASGVYWGNWTLANPGLYRAQGEELLAMCADGRIAPKVSLILPLDRAVEGFRALADRTVFGKIIVHPS